MNQGQQGSTLFSPHQGGEINETDSDGECRRTLVGNLLADINDIEILHDGAYRETLCGGRQSREPQRSSQCHIAA